MTGEARAPRQRPHLAIGAIAEFAAGRDVGSAREWLPILGRADAAVSRLARRGSCVEAWSGYPLQFGGMRRHGWQDDLAAELGRALAAVSFGAGDSLAGTYTTTDSGACDAENRLFTNPGASCFPRNVASIRFERGCGPVPDPPVPIDLVAGHLHYYRYCASGDFGTWERDRVLARWGRIPRVAAADGSARPMWLALRRAIAAGAIEHPGPTLADDAPFGVCITVHATASGPRSAPAISESFVDGVIAAFHAGAPNARAVARALALKLPGISPDELERLVALDWTGALFPGSPFILKGSFVQLSPCDERCLAGEVTITPDARGRQVETSGELFTLRARVRDTSVRATEHP